LGSAELRQGKMLVPANIVDFASAWVSRRTVLSRLEAALAEAANPREPGKDLPAYLTSANLYVRAFTRAEDYMDRLEKDRVALTAAGQPIDPLSGSQINYCLDRASELRAFAAEQVVRRAKDDPAVHEELLKRGWYPVLQAVASGVHGAQMSPADEPGGHSQ
jgi:hypothetical protein